MWMNPQKSKRDYLIELTDELEEFGFGSYIGAFESGCSKIYALSVFCP
jgi:hypothetical protein